MKDKINVLLNFGKNWFWIILPLIGSWLIQGPLSKIESPILYGYEFGIVFSNALISISAAGIFYLVMEFIPNKIRRNESINLLNENTNFLDLIIIQHINNIDKNIQFNNLDDFFKTERSKLTSLFLKINIEKEDYRINIPNSNLIGLDFYPSLLISSTNRMVDLKDIILFTPTFYPLKCFDYINKVLWFQEMLKDNSKKDKFIKQLCFELIINYLNFKQEIKRVI